jgi:hypothetical protein
MGIMKHHYVYKIVNTLNNKYYYGVHHGELDDDYYGSGADIKKAIKSEGKHIFRKDLVAICDDQKHALSFETAIIGDRWKTDPKCYNRTPGGGMPPSPKGKKMPPRSEEHKKKLSEAQKGKTHSTEAKAKLSAIAKRRTGKKRGPYKKKVK